ncbi:hypothetical protein JCGZ_06876 [Jatropha curcas]|uniref:O-methyltransferase domain-containing protein n=1 Tax=Jatropha curcas TaxID=180498 RepID=A0A067JC86_JATCU|nr:hypothetical protein JCGZ_06876 [Jatropha curcas]
MSDKEEAAAQTEIEMWKYVFGFSNIAVVKCAFELGIANAIENHQGPITLTDLSSTIGCNPSSLYRIMRFLVHHNIFNEQLTADGTKGYIQTPLSRRLLGPGENNMAAFVLLESSPVMLAPWHFLSSHVRLNGPTPFEAAYGDHQWKYTAANPGHSNLFNDGMACNARNMVSNMVEKCIEVFDGVKTLVDVGGGNGTALRTLVKLCPWIQGINFDLPHVVDVAEECVGVKHVGGDMFQCIPNADAAFLMENGKVIIVEAVIDEANDDKLEFVRLALDMVMMAHTTGKERTSKEWEYVLKEAGFSRHTIKSIATLQSVIEAFP